jgi:hypothetical protein
MHGLHLSLISAFFALTVHDLFSFVLIPVLGSQARLCALQYQRNGAFPFICSGRLTAQRPHRDMTSFNPVEAGIVANDIEADADADQAHRDRPSTLFWLTCVSITLCIIIAGLSLPHGRIAFYTSVLACLTIGYHVVILGMARGYLPMLTYSWPPTVIKDRAAAAGYLAICWVAADIGTCLSTSSSDKMSLLPVMVLQNAEFGIMIAVAIEANRTRGTPYVRQWYEI